MNNIYITSQLNILLVLYSFLFILITVERHFGLKNLLFLVNLDMKNKEKILGKATQWIQLYYDLSQEGIDETAVPVLFKTIYVPSFNILKRLVCACFVNFMGKPPFTLN